MRFSTKLEYDGRETKARYVYDKYGDILKGSILDVGSDACYLRDILGAQAEYVGIGIGGNPDIEVDLEKEAIPFPDNSKDCVLCLDVLEHLDNTHATFDELCRVSRRYVIISLPNSYRDFFGMLFGKEKDKALNFKYYGLPSTRPDDRHKWFFSNSDAEKYVRELAAKNKMKVVQIDSDASGLPGSLKSFVKRALIHVFCLFTCVKPEDLYHKTLWAVLEKQNMK